MANADNTHIRESGKARTKARINTMAEARAERYLRSIRLRICQTTNRLAMRERLYGGDAA